MKKNMGRLPPRRGVKRRERRKGVSLLSIGKKSYGAVKKAANLAKVLGKVYVAGRMIQGAVK